MGKFINPFTDWGFKHIFGREVSKDILIDFLNSLLEGERVIENLSFRNKEITPEAKDMTGVIYDIYCTTSTGEHIIVEMQNRFQQNFIDRALFYMSRALVLQRERGDSTYRLDAVYGVFLMNFDTADLPLKLRTDCALTDMKSHNVISGKIRPIFLQLPLFVKEEDECENDFERWMYVLKNMEILDRMPFTAQKAVLRKLMDIANVSTLTKADREKYDESIKVLRDNIAVYNGAVDLGERRGMERGIAIGEKRGEEKGIEIGKMEERKNMAKKLRASGTPLNVISQVSGFSEEEIQSL